MVTQDVINLQLPPAKVFKAYDIRGVVAEDGLNTDNVHHLGLALGAKTQSLGQKTVVVGRDVRVSGAKLQAALVDGLLQSGCDVIDIGIVPTPVLYFATYHFQNAAGVMVTASHNPPQYNGFKMMLAGRSVTSDEIQLLSRMNEVTLPEVTGEYRQYDIHEDYYRRILIDVNVHRSLKVVLDCGNGAASELAPTLFKRLGCEVIPLYCECDGRFPNHMPDPSRPENLNDLRAHVRETKADIGIAFDGDADRLAVVDSEGQVISADRVLMAYVSDVLPKINRGTVIVDVKTSRRVVQLVEDLDGNAIIWKSGHSLMKEKMRETQAVFAGELSGHVFFNDRWYGFDDGVYAAARLLEILANENQSSSDYFKQFPEGIATPEILVMVAEGQAAKIVAALQGKAQQFSGKPLLLDGLRVDYAEGWGLVRASNTMPCLTLRFEADCTQTLHNIQNEFKQHLLSVDAALDLPF